MELDVLTAISPIDGRYRGKTKALAAYFSEFALIKYRVQVEVEYFITLCELPLPQLKGIDNSVFETLRNIYRNFSEADAQRIKDIESVTNHDVKNIDAKVTNINNKVTNIDSKVTNIDSKVNDIDVKVNNQNTQHHGADSRALHAAVLDVEFLRDDRSPDGV